MLLTLLTLMQVKHRESKKKRFQGSTLMVSNESFMYVLWYYCKYQFTAMPVIVGLKKKPFLVLSFSYLLYFLLYFSKIFFANIFVRTQTESDCHQFEFGAIWHEFPFIQAWFCLHFQFFLETNFHDSGHKIQLCIFLHMEAFDWPSCRCTC